MVGTSRPDRVKGAFLAVGYVASYWVNDMCSDDTAVW